MKEEKLFGLIVSIHGSLTPVALSSGGTVHHCRNVVEKTCLFRGSWEAEDLASLHSLEGHVPSDLTSLPLDLLKVPSLPVTPWLRDQALST